ILCLFAKARIFETLPALRGKATASGRAAANHLSPECFLRVSSSSENSSGKSLRCSEANLFKELINLPGSKLVQHRSLPASRDCFRPRPVQAQGHYEWSFRSGNPIRRPIVLRGFALNEECQSSICVARQRW